VKPDAAGPESGGESGIGWSAALLANAAVIAVAAGFAWLHAHDVDLYYRSVQEDEALEWATFWGFAGATLAFGVAALRQWRRGAGLPWFPLGVALFCFFVAMEEISWGQRLIGYRPPVYFLKHNFQQELNVHNVVAVSLRKLVLKGVILGYGVALPLLAAVPALRLRFQRLDLTPPPLALLPAFLATYVLYEWYPLHFSGEIVEAMLGGSFLFSALALVARFAGAAAQRPRRQVGAVAVATLLVAGLGSANAALSRHQRSVRPENLEAARIELAALRNDFQAAGSMRRSGVPTSCGTHVRLYTLMSDKGADWLSEGRFVRLVERGLPEERADFLLDPWNLPYWVRDHCDRAERRRVVFVYSFGPNHRRDSTAWEIGGDDVGAIVKEWPAEGESDADPPSPPGS
jgi:hypothetical protein